MVALPPDPAPAPLPALLNGAGAVVYLASPLAAYVTGQVVVVDGGCSVDG